VLGLLAWLYLQAQATLYAVEVAVVRARKLWPRGLAKPLTAQDRRAYALYAEATRRNADESVEVGTATPAEVDASEPGEVDADEPGEVDVDEPVSPHRSGGPGAAA
jgi:hypothetical protein